MRFKEVLHLVWKCQLTFLPYTFRQGRIAHQWVSRCSLHFFERCYMLCKNLIIIFLFTKVQNRVVHGSISQPHSKGKWVEFFNYHKSMDFSRVVISLNALLSWGEREAYVDCLHIPWGILMNFFFLCHIVWKSPN